MDPRRQELLYEAVRADLDGLDRFEIEQRACHARTVWQSAAPEARAVAGAQAAAIGRILIHLRRTWTDVYEAADHQKRARAAERIDPSAAAQVRAAGHPVGARVEVVGEERTGVVQQVLVTREEDGSYARWYVVHVAELRVCRAYGCDELETLDVFDGPVVLESPHGAQATAVRERVLVSAR
jgi:hypothetical protein